MSLSAVLITFGVIFLAELPDKTMVASLVLGSRYRPLYVWAGVAAAFAIQVTLAVAAGSVISLLPARVVDAVAALLFAVGAVLVLREGREDDDAVTNDAVTNDGATNDGATVQAGGSTSTTRSAALPTDSPSGTTTSTGFLRVAATSFAVVFVAELGDLTQISTANLSARFSAPLAVWLGSLLALWSVAALAIAGGRGLLRVLSVRLITRIAATAFTVLAVFSLVDAIRG